MSALVIDRTEGVASTFPIHPFFFALYPIARLYEENVYEVSLGDVVGPLLVVMVATAAALGIAALALREVRRAAIVTSSVVLPVMLFGLVHEVVEPSVGDIRFVLLALALGLIVLAIVAARRLGPRLGQVTLGLNVFSVVLMILAVAPALQGVVAEVSADEDVGISPTEAVTAATVPERDIYHLVLDRYGSEAALDTGLGIDNSEFVAWLRRQGFEVVDDAYANYTKTLPSLASTLGMELLDEVVEAVGPESGDLSPVEYRVKHSRAGAFMQDNGYDYIHIGSWFVPTRESRIADRSDFPRAEIGFSTTLYDLSVLPLLLEGSERVVDSKLRHAESVEYQFDRLEAIAARPGPTYVLAHILVPHPPFVFLADGSYAPDTATFESQLGDVNRRLRAFIEPLLALPADERPIIVLQGDEGPYPERWEESRADFDWSTATEAELLTKFGILNAMYLPGAEGAVPLRDGLTAVNTYPELLRRYFGSDIEDQPDRVMASNESRPFDLVDITSRLEATEGG